MIDSAQLLEAGMNILFPRLLWKYVCVIMVAREMAVVAYRNGIYRLENNALNTGHRPRGWYSVRILSDNRRLSLPPRMWVVDLVDDVNRMVQATGSSKGQLSDNVTINSFDVNRGRRNRLLITLLINSSL
jgi:hypothetical protein